MIFLLSCQDFCACTRSTFVLDAKLTFFMVLPPVENFNEDLPGIDLGTTAIIQVEVFYWDSDTGYAVLLEDSRQAEFVVKQPKKKKSRRGGGGSKKGELPALFLTSVLGFTTGTRAMVVIAPQGKNAKTFDGTPSQDTCHMIYKVEVVDFFQSEEQKE